MTPARSSAARRAFVLAHEEGRRRYLLKEGLNRVGSVRSSEVPLQARGVSKCHAILVVQPDRMILEDLASKNGTFVNGARVETTWVSPGDDLSFGTTILRLEEVSPTEGELAITLAEADPRETSSGLSRETSRVLAIQGSGNGERWLRVVEGLVERLCSAPTGNLVSALAVVVAELDAVGACLVDLGEAGSPAVLASYGELEEESLVAGRLAAGHRSGGGIQVRHFSSRVEGGAPMTVATSEATALALWGDVALQREVVPLLRTFLRLIERFQPRVRAGGAAPTVRAPASRELVFPDGYVRFDSSCMVALYQQMQAVARSDVPILILGETGVGKEGIGRILHRSSDRSRGPYVPINCAAIPAELLEAELFGIGRGVATGVAERKGKFELAQGGTLVLDEIGDMSKDLQAKLLRTLQEKEIQPVGRPAMPIDVRVVAATNSGLSRRMESGSFRRDLYYRLVGFVLTIPPLREHREDVPALVEQFLLTYCEEAGKSLRGMTIGALQRLTRRQWPGNIRELEYEVRRLVYLCPAHQAIDSSMLSIPLPEAESDAASTQGSAPADAEPDPPPADPSRSLGHLSLAQVDRLRLAEIEEQVVMEALERSSGNRTHAARALGISREALRRRLARFARNGAS